jgi:2-oxoglutarate ferredoxin oxidoreductase subunit gamma
VVNSKLVDPATLRADLVAHPVDAGAIAVEVASAQAIGFVLLGAYNAVTGMVSPQALVEAMTELLPPYRRQYAAANARALEAGASALAGVA